MTRTRLSFHWLGLSRGSNVMRSRDWTEVILAYMVTMATWLLGGTVGPSVDQYIYPETSSMRTSPHFLPEQHPAEVCCSGVLGYASDNVSLTYPCQRHPCCNSSHIVTVTAIDFALGFRFQCMPIKNVQTLCYQSGAEVRTTNQDPDFIPRACCQGLKLKVVFNQWYAAMVVKCEEENSDRVS